MMDPTAIQYAVTVLTVATALVLFLYTLLFSYLFVGDMKARKLDDVTWRRTVVVYVKCIPQIRDVEPIAKRFPIAYAMCIGTVAVVYPMTIGLLVILT